MSTQSIQVIFFILTCLSIAKKLGYKIFVILIKIIKKAIKNNTQETEGFCHPVQARPVLDTGIRDPLNQHCNQ